jgi:hypothetical protein
VKEAIGASPVSNDAFGSAEFHSLLPTIGFRWLLLVVVTHSVRFGYLVRRSSCFRAAIAIRRSDGAIISTYGSDTPLAVFLVQDDANSRAGASKGTAIVLRFS